LICSTGPQPSGCIQIGQRDFVKRHIVELPEEAVAQHFDGNAGSIGQKEGCGSCCVN
jgi:hypothetical protein